MTILLCTGPAARYGMVRARYRTDAQRNAYAVYIVRYGIETVTFY